MIFRAFASNVEDLAKKCLHLTDSKEPFKPIGSGVGGMSVAYPVEMHTGRPAFAKPKNQTPETLAGVANEKITSDLAYHLRLPVAPVEINCMGAAVGMCERVAISYVALAGAAHWGQVYGALMQPQRDSLKPILSAMWAFHAWVNDQDHNWNDGNALLVVENGQPIPCFIDYTLSLMVNAPAQGPVPTQPWGPPAGPPYTPIDTAAMSEAVHRIESMPDDTIRATVNAVPDVCLAQADRDRLIAGLCARRGQLRQMLKI